MIFFLQIAFHIRNFKRRRIEQLIDHEEKLLRDVRHQSPNDDSNQNNNNGAILNRQSTLITPQHFTQIPEKSILNHQQVYNN